MDQLPRQTIAIVAKTDEIWYKELKLHLALLKRLGKVNLWHSSDVLPAHDIFREYQSRLDTASLLLLFLSPDFFASADCQSQFQQALARQIIHPLTMLPILVHPVDVSASPLATIKAVPGNGQAITQWSDHDLAFSEIVAAIRILLFPSLPNT